MRSPVRALVVAAALVAGAPAAAVARPVRQAPPSRHLWATINVCDTLAHPDTIGIRGSMPGTGHRREQMFMRFRVEYFVAGDQRWHHVSAGGDSGFVRVGSAKYKARQGGRLFVFAPPTGGSFEMRGVVTFEWRRGHHVLRRARMTTTAGHHVAQADPANYSSDTCVIS